jgi:hypothetical protein
VNGVIVVIAGASAVLGLASAFIGIMNGRRAIEAARLAKEQAGIVQKISVEVDGRLSAFIAREMQLTGILKDEGIPVPPMPGLKTGEKRKI